ncbi:MAG: 30S ribosomal protein S3 [Acidilobaceae archaeon]
MGGTSPKLKKFFLEQSLSKVKLDEYLAQVFYEAGYAGVNVTKTALGTRVHIYAERPALIIGKKGQTIRELQKALSTVMGFENPQVTVSTPENIELNARIQAFRFARLLERGFHFRRIAFAMVRRIMANGALGVEITVSGKLATERARFEKFREGKVYKAGHVVDMLVDRAVAYARLPKGIVGVEIIITKPGTPPDYVRVKEPQEVQSQLEKIRAYMVEKGIAPMVAEAPVYAPRVEVEEEAEAEVAIESIEEEGR